MKKCLGSEYHSLFAWKPDCFFEFGYLLSSNVGIFAKLRFLLSISLSVWCLIRFHLDYNRLVFRFPDEGLLFTYSTFPSSNRTVTAPRFDKHVCLAWSNEPNPKLDMPAELRSLYFWRCSVKDEESIDPCGRPCGAGAHVSSLIFFCTLLCLCSQVDNIFCTLMF